MAVFGELESIITQLCDIRYNIMSIRKVFKNLLSFLTLIQCQHLSLDESQRYHQNPNRYIIIVSFIQAICWPIRHQMGAICRYFTYTDSSVIQFAPTSATLCSRKQRFAAEKTVTLLYKPPKCGKRVANIHIPDWNYSKTLFTESNWVKLELLIKSDNKCKSR